MADEQQGGSISSGNTATMAGESITISGVNLSEDIGKLSNDALDARIDQLGRSNEYQDKTHIHNKRVKDYMERAYQRRYPEDAGTDNLTEGEKSLNRTLKEAGVDEDYMAEVPSVTPEELQIESEILEGEKQMMQMHHSRERAVEIVLNAQEGLKRIGISEKEIEAIETSGLGNDATFLTAAAIVNAKLKEKGLSRVAMNDKPQNKEYKFRSEKERQAYYLRESDRLSKIKD